MDKGGRYADGLREKVRVRQRLHGKAGQGHDDCAHHARSGAGYGGDQGLCGIRERLRLRAQDCGRYLHAAAFGLVYVLVTSADKIECLEKETLEGRWLTVDELRTLRNEGRMESWSEIVFDNLLAEEVR